MKLYATTTSERASKGQGGNEYVVSEFNVEREVIGQVELYLFDDDKSGYNENEWVLKFREGGEGEGNDWEILAQGHIPAKSKKQKGECANGYQLPCNICPKDGKGNCTT